LFDFDQDHAKPALRQWLSQISTEQSAAARNDPAVLSKYYGVDVGLGIVDPPNPHDFGARP
jgi:hypothetical protein